MAEHDDELARTATAVPSAASNPTIPVGATLGRYRLERELGQGGMGVVHAAFDPDLERRIALKVLRTAETEDAQKRLLREARAMARLSHPNVVTVHEVGSAAGRDYVAMELITGVTLADWLRMEKRSEREILAAFVAAGRGLAAAHAAGIVHRDYKPHNVLRSNEGRIVVTDFGLARDAEPDATTATMPMRASRPVGAGESTPSSLSGLTQTGSVLGTPAYMAPEQWTGGAVTPATDQFAFCVALWEALAGERPYRALSAEALRAEVCAGPAKLDASKLPRRLRRVLKRGLDPTPAKRWPSMDALITAITRAERRPGLALAIAGGAMGAAAILFFAIRPGGSTAAACTPPPRAPATVWSAPLAAELAAPIAKVFQADFDRWQAARGNACQAPETERAAQLHCLDGVLLRFDSVRRAVERVAKISDDDVAQLLLEPSLCVTLDPPRLALPSTPDVITAFELYARTMPDDTHPAEDDVAQFLERSDLEPCARAIADLALEKTTHDVPKKRIAMTDAQSASEQCSDDYLRAEVLGASAPYMFELPVIGPKGQAAIQRAEVAAKRIGGADLLAPIDAMRGYVASQQENWTETFARYDKALAEFGERKLVRRQLGLVVEIDALRFIRGTPEDYAEIAKHTAHWLPIAKQAHDQRHLDQLARDDAHLVWLRGDVAKAHAALVAAWNPDREPDVATRPFEGTVLDRAGKPVGGATVSVAERLVADAIGVMPPMDLHDPSRSPRATTTDDRGHFAFDDAPVHGTAIAQLGDLRSAPASIADNVTLALAPTRTIKGKVTLGTMPNTRVLVVAEIVDEPNDAYHVIAPIAPDGTYTLAGVPLARVEVSVEIPSRHFGSSFTSKRVEPGTKDLAELDLAIPTGGRAIDVIARSELPIPLDMAQVLVMPGHAKLLTVAELIKRSFNGLQMRFAHAVIGENVPQALFGKLRAGDLVVHFESVPLGDITVCAIGLNGDMMDKNAMSKIQAHIGEVGIKCDQIGDETSVLTLETPPQKRFE